VVATILVDLLVLEAMEVEVEALITEQLMVIMRLSTQVALAVAAVGVMG